MKVIMLAAITADGKIAHSEHEFVNWTSKDDKQFFAKVTKEARVIVIGKRTFDTFPGPLPGRLHIVMTRNPNGQKNQQGIVEYTSASPKEILASLSKREYSTIVIAGGAHIYSLFLKERLVDEIMLTVEPKIFGSGIGLLSDLPEIRLRLIEYRLLNPNVLLLTYKPIYK